MNNVTNPISTPKEQQITVFIADDHQALIAGVSSVLEKGDIEVVGSTTVISEVPQLFEQSKADVLLLDVKFTEQADNGFDIAQRILSNNPQTKIVAFSQFDDTYLIEKAYKIGFKSFVSKNDTGALVDAVRNTQLGLDYFAPKTSHKLANEALHSKDPRKLLTERELEVFLLYANGVVGLEASKAISMTYPTVHSCLLRIKSKLGIESIADFTKVAIKYGLIEP